MEEPKPYQVIYSYEDVPTVKRFALDNTRMRCIIGPFGSGKTSGCVMEIIRRAHEMVAGPDGIRRSRWAVVRNCFDDQTEILTEDRGWQLFKNLTDEDRVGVYENGLLRFEYPIEKFTDHYKGEMIGYKNGHVDFLVTPDHNLYVSHVNRRKELWTDFYKIPAKNIYGKSTYRFTTVAEVTGYKSEHTPDFFEFLGFYFAEGCVTGRKGGRKRLYITQKNNVEYTEKLFDKNKISYRKNSRGKNKGFNFIAGISDFNTLLAEELKQYGTAKNKFLPVWIKKAPAIHLRAFIHGFAMGDGHIRKHKHDTTRLYTSSPSLANDLQEICFKAGYSTRLVQRKNLMFTITLFQDKFHTPETMNTKNWYKVNYDGFVYCVHVSSGLIVSRRNGKNIIISNTYAQLKDTTIRTFHDWFPPKVFGTYHVTDHNYYITKFPGIHLELCFRALDRDDQVSNLLSFEFTSAYFNEVREIPWTIIEYMDGRIGRYPSKRDVGEYWHGIIMDTNPPDDSSTLYKLAEETKPDNFKVFKQPSGLSVRAENTKHLPKNYYQNLAKGKSEMYTRVYIHGRYGYLAFGDPVFASYSDSFHVAPYPIEVDKKLPLFIGMDFSIVGCVIGQLTPFGQLRILDELTSEGLMGIRQFCLNRLLPLLRTKYFGMSVAGFGDRSGLNRTPTDESTCFDILHSQDIGLSNITEAPTNALAARIDPVEEFLLKSWKGEPGFLISPNCKILRKAMNGGYHYEKDPKSKSNNENKLIPAKNYSSHIADALEYLCMFVANKEADDIAWKKFSAQIKKKDYRPASSTVGY